MNNEQTLSVGWEFNYQCLAGRNDKVHANKSKIQSAADVEQQNYQKLEFREMWFRFFSNWIKRSILEDFCHEQES